ncbi:MAG: RNA methyltransferase [Archangiaceae bacterium]|nr:RNA methyltransferase [Archangiaceae bacterium]
MSPPVRIVLLRPRNADNLGAIARAMKNFGLSDWVVVSPNPKLLEVPGMNRLAVHAGELLESVARVESLAEAVKDCSWVVGTTMRRIEGRRRVSPEAVGDRARTEARVALVFGDERSGLSNEDLEQCHDVSSIPASEEQPSLNLAQAVLVYAYELARKPAAEAPGPAAADDALLRQVGTSLNGVLGGEHPELMRTLVRARLSRREAEHWQASLRAVAKRRP